MCNKTCHAIFRNQVIKAGAWIYSTAPTLFERGKRMNNSSTRISRLWGLPLSTVLLLGVMAMDAHAQNYGYWQDHTGAMVRSGTGTCVRTGNWTPELATAECDPDLMSKTAAAAPADPAPVARSAPPPVTVTEKVAMDADALFDFDKSAIKPKGKEALDEVVRKLNLAGAELRLITSTGHTDSVGSTEYNIDLSLRRAESVKAYLISQGIDGGQINSVGVGERQPFANNTTAKGRAENRRVDIEVSSTRTTQ
jgi:OmpA-OmpF porin, OOP family